MGKPAPTTLATLLAYRRALATALDDLGVYTLSSGTGNTAVAPLLVTGATGTSVNRFDQKYVTIASGDGAGQTRRVRTGGYVPATGTLTVDPAWDQPSSGDVIEVTGYFPAFDQVGSDTSYRTLINAALRKIVTPDRLTLAVGGDAEFALTAYRWLDREERLVAVWEPGPRSASPVLPAIWRRPRLRLDAHQSVLEMTVPLSSASGVLYLDVLRLADTWIAVGGTWGESSVGLVDDTDEATPTVEDVVRVGMAEAYLALMSRAPGRPSGPWIEQYGAAKQEAERVRYFDDTAQKDAPPAAAPVGAP